MKTKECCGNCGLFTNEHSDGSGWCVFHQEPSKCKENCIEHTERLIGIILTTKERENYEHNENIEYF
ncbi:MAG: hypothetical protein WCI04_06955 [archaeon]